LEKDVELYEYFLNSYFPISIENSLKQNEHHEHQTNHDESEIIVKKNLNNEVKTVIKDLNANENSEEL
jgi:hypothetical protein